MTNQLIAELRVQLAFMKTDEERQQALQSVLEGFCHLCGSQNVKWRAKLGDFQDCCSVTNAETWSEP